MMAVKHFPHVPVSWGELIDKISILEIKAGRLHIPEAASNVQLELGLLTTILTAQPALPTELATLKVALNAVNLRLWDIEDAIRVKEATKSFDAAFIELARSVYRTNDERARIKRRINELLNSGIIEEKQYTPYRPDT